MKIGPELVDTWMAATEACDVPVVLDLMTDDVVLTVSDQEPFGKEAFTATVEGTNDVQIEGTSEIRVLEVLGE